jgi:hypothetical protein
MNNTKRNMINGMAATIEDFKIRAMCIGIINLVFQQAAYHLPMTGLSPTNRLSTSYLLPAPNRPHLHPSPPIHNARTVNTCFRALTPMINSLARDSTFAQPRSPHLSRKANFPKLSCCSLNRSNLSATSPPCIASGNARPRPSAM